MRSVFKSESIDPIHVFSSFNRSNQNIDSRTTVLNRWFELLGSKKSAKAVDFNGCPTPFLGVDCAYTLAVYPDKSGLLTTFIIVKKL